MIITRLVLMLSLILSANRAFALDCGDATQPCKIDGGEYHLAVPAGWKGGPAVIHLHGYASSGAKVIARESFVKRFTSRGYALIAPTALPWGEGKPNDWAVLDGWPVYPRRDDMFLREVLADAVVRFGIKPDRVLLTGFSRGGSMVWDMACHVPDFARAYAPAAGGFWLPMPKECAGATHFLHIHGFVDPMVPLEGRTWRNEEFKFTNSQADIWEGLQLWRRENNCPNNADGHDVSNGLWRKRWKCENGGLELLLHKGGHGLPKGWTNIVLDWFEGIDR